MLENNPKTVKIVIKNMPLSFHEFADDAAIASFAAQEQNKFWEFHDELFSAEELSKEVILEIAIKLNLDIAKFKSAINSKRLQRKLAIDLSDAREAGVTGTPTIFINGHQLKNRTLAAFQQLISKELAKHTSQ